MCNFRHGWIQGFQWYPQDSASISVSWSLPSPGWASFPGSPIHSVPLGCCRLMSHQPSPTVPAHGKRGIASQEPHRCPRIATLWSGMGVGSSRNQSWAKGVGCLDRPGLGLLQPLSEGERGRADMVVSSEEEEGCWAHSSRPSHFLFAALRVFLPTGHLGLGSDRKPWKHIRWPPTQWIPRDPRPCWLLFSVPSLFGAGRVQRGRSQGLSSAVCPWVSGEGEEAGG